MPQHESAPKGHFLDNLIETTNTFRKQNTIYWILNKNFDHQNTYLPHNIRIFKNIFSNNFKRKKNKIFYILEEFIFFLINLYNNIYYLIYFTLENKTLCSPTSSTALSLILAIYILFTYLSKNASVGAVKFEV